jgi:hypothetical protein
VHGIANRPEREVLHEQWRVALYEPTSGLTSKDLDATCSMVYWADLLNANPSPPAWH